MVQPDKRIKISHGLARKLFPLILAMGLVIAFIIPGLYCYLEFNRIRSEADLYSRQLALDIRKLASNAPTLWKYQATKYLEIVENFIPNKQIQKIIVLDERSKSLDQFGYIEKIPSFFGQFGIKGQPVKIIFNNKMIGELQIHIAAKSFLIRLFIVFIVCFVMGTSLSVIVYRVPIAVAKKLEQQVMSYQSSLEEQVLERTAALQETTATALQLADERSRDQQALLEAKETLEQRVAERTQELQAEVSAKAQALTELAAAQSSLVEMSRAAGMAEVATGVLHNVGNVLNSVNVSCNLLIDKLVQSRMANVVKVADLLQQHQGNLSEFLTSDVRGRQITGYMNSLAPVLEEERQTILKETHALRDRIDHIKEIVSMQQTYGRVSGVLETIAPEQLMEDALKLNTEALARHHIVIDRQYREVLPLTVDKHKVLQILLNLVNNAKYACSEMEKDKIITLRIFPSGPDRLSFQVSDNGEGILPENLTRIFQHGFTTRKTGHGFGLHSGAIAAKALGGSLTAHSDGPGLGASFTLELPCSRKGEMKENS